MKTYLPILLSLTLVGFLTLSSFNNPDEDIIGTWILESDTDSKWVFTTNNCYWYYEGNLKIHLHMYFKICLLFLIQVYLWSMW